MRKGFPDDNSKEMEVVLKIRVPMNFDGPMEEKIDRALADALYDMGCELVDSKEYRDVPEWSKSDGLDNWRKMIREEIALNGVAIYGMSEEEATAMRQDAESLDLLAEYLERTMYRVHGDPYRALDLIFQEDFCDVLDEFRKERLEKMVNHLGLFYDAKVNGQILFVDCWKGESVEIFLAYDGGLMCLLPDEDEPRALRENIQDVEPGDAFLFGGGGSIRTASEAARQNFDEPDNPWILYGDDGDSYFEEDFGSDLGKKMRALLEGLKQEQKPLGDVLNNAAERSEGFSSYGAHKIKDGALHFGNL